MIVTMQDYTITDRAPVLIGYEGENLSRNFTVKTFDDLSGIASFELLIGDVNCGAMTVNDTEITISLDSFMIGKAGYKKAQLIMLDDTGAVVMKSNQFDVLVGASNNPRYYAAGEKVKTLTVSIDGRTRQIILPAGFAVSVNGDVAVDHIAFKAPASYGDFYFGAAACRVDWTGVDGTSHTNICVEKDADGNWIWALPTALTRGGEGEISFSVSYIVTDATTGAVTADWNTGLVKFYHLESAKSDDAEEDVEEETTYDRLASAIAAVQSAQASVDDVNAILAGITSATPTVVETVADLNGLDTSKVKLAIVAADGYLYYYNGTAWVSGFAYGGLQEVIAARTDSAGVTHADLKTRLNTAEAQIKEDLSANAESTDYSVKQLSSFKNVDGYVYIEPTDWEIGGFNVSNGVITYGANSKRIRTKQGFGYTVFAGDVIGLKDYAELGFYVALKYAKDGVIYSGGFKSADYTVPNDGEIYIYIAKRSAEVQIDNVYNYLGNLFIRRVDSTVSSIKKSYSGLSQYAIDHQNDTPIVFSDPSINNIIVCGKNIFRTPHGMTTYNSNNVYKTFNEKNGTITVRSDGATGNVVAPNTYTEVNGVAWNCMYKFKLPSATNVVFSTNADKDLYLYGKIYAQISDGNKVINAYNEPVIFKAEANTEYGVRIYSASGYADTVTFKPQIELGTTNRTEFEAFSGIVDENGSIISINTPSENLETGVIVKGYTATIISYDNAVSFTCEAPTEYDNGNAIYRIKNSKPAYKKPMLSFIDDDTTSTAFVEQYYNVMHGLGVVGNYAAITKKLTENEALKNLLLQYEAEGYGVLLHCYNQVGTDTDYFRPDSARNIDLVRTNMITGLRTMNDFGFISKDYWVTPYGVNDVEIKELAKSLGLKAVISTLNDTPNTQKTDRYEIGRYSFAATETSIAQNIPCIKRGMDACIENGGWVIVTTHVNSWGEGASIASDALSEIVDYANEIGMKIVNFQEGFETYIG